MAVPGLLERAEETLEFVDRVQLRVIDKGQDRGFDALLDPLDEGFQYSGLGSEVVEKGPAGH